MTVEDSAGHHLAFDVDPDTFDQILARIRELDVPFGNSPRTLADGRVDTRCARGVCSSPTRPATSTRSCRRPEAQTNSGSAADRSASALIVASSGPSV